MMIRWEKWSPLLAFVGIALVLLFNAPVRAADDNTASSTQGRVPLPAKIVGKGTQCVQPTPEMRRNHMKYILHHRDETVHEGIRTKQYSLKECINCHVVAKPDGSYPSIHTSEHFCNSCHTYAAVKIDCFECHVSHPNEKGASDTAAPSPSTSTSSLRIMAKARAAGEMAQ